MIAPIPNLPSDTRQRLIEAAGQIFADRGFRDATIREICQVAGANIAAVNYHFRDKEGLYAAVLHYSHRCAQESHPVNLSPNGSTGRAEALRAFVRAFLRRLLDTGRPAWHGRLMAREMVEPTAALDTLVEQNVRPQAEALLAIVRALLGPSVDEQQVRFSAASVVGQCLYYHNCRPVIERLFPQFTYDPATIDRLADHIADFSLRGLGHPPTPPFPPFPHAAAREGGHQ